MKIQTPQQLVAALVELFPAFREEWDDGEAYGQSGDYSFYTIFMELAPVCAGYLAKASPRTLRSFCIIIEDFVSSGGDKKNSIAACLLEHASQIGIAKTIKPHLSRAAKSELR